MKSWMLIGVIAVVAGIGLWLYSKYRKEQKIISEAYAVGAATIDTKVSAESIAKTTEQLEEAIVPGLEEFGVNINQAVDEAALQATIPDVVAEAEAIRTEVGRMMTSGEFISHVLLPSGVLTAEDIRLFARPVTELTSEIYAAQQRRRAEIEELLDTETSLGEIRNACGQIRNAQEAEVQRQTTEQAIVEEPLTRRERYRARQTAEYVRQQAYEQTAYERYRETTPTAAKEQYAVTTEGEWVRKPFVW